ncbi:hypothetical protein FF1_008738 [Malus domestica]
MHSKLQLGAVPLLIIRMTVFASASTKTFSNPYSVQYCKPVRIACASAAAAQWKVMVPEPPVAWRMPAKSLITHPALALKDALHQDASVLSLKVPNCGFSQRTGIIGGDFRGRTAPSSREP